MGTYRLAIVLLSDTTESEQWLRNVRLSSEAEYRDDKCLSAKIHNLTFGSVWCFLIFLVLTVLSSTMKCRYRLYGEATGHKELINAVTLKKLNCAILVCY